MSGCYGNSNIIRMRMFIFSSALLTNQSWEFRNCYETVLFMLLLTFSRSSFPWSCDLTNSILSVRNPTYIHKARESETFLLSSQTHELGFKLSKELRTCLSLSLSFLSVFSSMSWRCSTFLSISSLCSLMTVSSWPSYAWKNTEIYFHWYCIHKAESK